MAFSTTHIALAGGATALALSAAGADSGAVSISITSAVALRVAWPDLAMVWPSVKAMYYLWKAGEDRWWKARDWTEYDRYHHPKELANEDVLFKFHRLVDGPYHRTPGESW